MAASQLELSTQWRFWRLSASELGARRTAAHRAALSALSSSAADAPSLTDADAARFVDYYTRRLALMCDVALQLPDGIQATAVTYMKRFYVSRSILEYHPKRILRTALFLACKTEERYYESAQFAALLHQGADAADDVVRLEPVVLDALQFHLGVRHPFEPLHGFIIDARASGLFAAGEAAGGPSLDQLHTAARGWVSRALQTDLLFEWPPATIALACFLESASSAPASRTAFLSYLHAKFPVVGEHEAMLARIQGIATVVRQHPEATDDAARAIDLVLQRLLAQPQAAGAGAGANGGRDEDEDDLDDDDDA